MDPEPDFPRTLEAAVDRIVTALDDDSRRLLLSTPQDRLIEFHMGWGMGIRNDFGLWGRNPELLADCGSSEMHPDEASTIVMRAVWNRLHGVSIDEARYRSTPRLGNLRDAAGREAYYRLCRERGAKEQQIYRILKDSLGMEYKEFKELVAKVEREDGGRHEDGHPPRPHP
jgi:hypothetical protein